MQTTIDVDHVVMPPREAEFAGKCAALTDDELYLMTLTCCRLSREDQDLPDSDYHWKVDCCFLQWHLRGKRDLYHKAWREARR